MVGAFLGSGAFAFGAVVGWNLYWLNRYRTGDIKVTDLVTVISAIGGAVVLKLFPAGTDLFGWYGLGLAAGFFGYFIVLLILVLLSRPDFKLSWFLDGRSQVGGKVVVPKPGGSRPLESEGGEPV